MAETKKQRELRLAEEQARRESQIKRLPSASRLATQAVDAINPGRMSTPFNAAVNKYIEQVVRPRIAGLPLTGRAPEQQQAPSPPAQASIPSIPPRPAGGIPPAPDALGPSYPVVPRQLMPTPDQAPPRYQFNDAAEAPAGRVEQMLQKRLSDRARLADRNVSQVAAAMQPGGGAGLGGIGPEDIARRKYADYRRFGNAGVVLKIPGAPAQATAEEETPPPSATAYGRRRGVSELSGGGNMPDDMRARIQQGFAENAAARNKNQYKLASGDYGNQSDAARERAAYLATHGGRPTQHSQNAARLDYRLAMAKKMQDAQLAPQLALIAAQKGLDPLQTAHANQLNAQADYYRGAAGQSAGGVPPGTPVPGAPGGGAPPGAPPDSGWQGIGREAAIAGGRIGQGATTFIHGAEYARRKGILESQIGPRTPANAAQYDAMLKNMMND